MERIIKFVVEAWRWSRPRPSAPADDDLDRNPGLEVVANKISIERQIRLATYDALGVKAGIIATATVALTALTANGNRPWVIAGLTFAGIALILAGIVLWPRELTDVKVIRLRDYMVSSPRVMHRDVSQIEAKAVLELEATNGCLAKVLMGSYVALAISATLLITAIVTGNPEEPAVPEKPNSEPTDTPAPRRWIARPEAPPQFSTRETSSPASQPTGADASPPVGAAPPLNPDPLLSQMNRRNFDLDTTEPARIERPVPRFATKTVRDE